MLRKMKEEKFINEHLDMIKGHGDTLSPSQSAKRQKCVSNFDSHFNVRTSYTKLYSVTERV